MSGNKHSIEHQWRKLGDQSSVEPPDSTVVTNAYEEGFAQGEADAKAQFDNEQRPLLNQLTQLATVLEDSVRKVREQAHAEVVQMVAALFGAMLGKQLFGCVETFEQAVEVLKENLDDPGSEFRIHLSPTDAALLNQALAQEARPNELLWIADDTVACGAMRIQSEFIVAEFNVIDQVGELLNGLAPSQSMPTKSGLDDA